MKRLAIIAVLAAFCVGAQAQEKLYEVKSGKITMEMDMMGQTMVQEIYFDDYGAKQATVMNMQGQKMRQITKDGSNIMIDDAAKTATKMPAMGMMGGGEQRINFSNLDEKTIKKNKIQEAGEETVAGKTCKVYKYKGQFDFDEAEKKVFDYLKTHEFVDGIFASSDVLAIGAMKAAHSLDVQIPGELQLVGFDGISMGKLLTPELTTVAQDIYKLGTAATELLIQKIEGHEIENNLTELPATLVIRSSTK